MFLQFSFCAVWVITDYRETLRFLRRALFTGLYLLSARYRYDSRRNRSSACTPCSSRILIQEMNKTNNRMNET